MYPIFNDLQLSPFLNIIVFNHIVNKITIYNKLTHQISKKFWMFIWNLKLEISYDLPVIKL